MPTYTAAELQNIYLPLNINRAQPNNFEFRTVERPNNSINLYAAVVDILDLEGLDTFLALTDTPSTYIPNFIVTVNSTGTGLEFTDPTTFTANLYNTSDSLTDPRTVTQGAHSLTFNSSGGAWTYNNIDGGVNTTFGANSSSAFMGYINGSISSTFLGDNSSAQLTHSSLTDSASVLISDFGIGFSMGASTDFRLNGQPGNVGDVITSQGAGNPVIWAPPAGGGTNLYLSDGSITPGAGTRTVTQLVENLLFSASSGDFSYASTSGGSVDFTTVSGTDSSNLSLDSTQTLLSNTDGTDTGILTLTGNDVSLVQTDAGGRGRAFETIGNEARLRHTLGTSQAWYRLPLETVAQTLVTTPTNSLTMTLDGSLVDPQALVSVTEGISGEIASTIWQNGIVASSATDGVDTSQLEARPNNVLISSNLINLDGTLRHSTSTISSSTTATLGTYVYYLDGGASPVDLTLPASPVNGDSFSIKSIDDSNDTRVLPNTGHTIDGDSFVKLLVDSSVTVVFDSSTSTWLVKSSNRRKIDYRVVAAGGETFVTVPGGTLPIDAADILVTRNGIVLVPTDNYTHTPATGVITFLGGATPLIANDVIYIQYK